MSISQVNLNLDHLPEVVKVNHDAFVEKSSEGDFIQYQSLQPNWSSLLRNAPLALWSGLFRPFLTDINTTFKIFAAAENTVLMILLLFQIPRWGKSLQSEYNLWLLSAIIYIVLLSVFLSLSTPNFGTLVRYKAGFSFVFTYLILYDHPIIRIIKTKLNYG